MARVQLQDTVLRNRSGLLAAVPGASVQVNVHGGAAATLYADDASDDLLANPLTADGEGVFSAFVEEGTYDVVVNGGAPKRVEAFVGGATGGFALKSHLELNWADEGAIGDGNVVNADANRAAWDSAIAKLKVAGRGKLKLPMGIFWVRPSSTPANYPADIGADLGLHFLGIDGDNISIEGSPLGGTVIKCAPRIGASNELSWVVTGDGKVWRGGGIFIAGGDDAGSKRRNITLKDFELDGGASYTGNNVFPANVGTGDGWDITHKGVWIENDKYADNIRLERVHVHGFKGEIVYGGGHFIDRVVARDCELHETNGDCWSVEGRNRVTDCEMYKAAGQGIEDLVGTSKPSWYLHNQIHDIDGTGVVLQGKDTVASPTGLTHAHFNEIRNCARGVYFPGARHLRFTDNEIVDCGTGTKRAIHLDTSSGGANVKLKDVVVARNRVICDQVTLNNGIAVIDVGGVGFEDVAIYDNDVLITDEAIAAGRTFNDPFELSATVAALIRWRNNRAKGTTFHATDQAQASDVLLTTNAVTTVAQIRPVKKRNWLIGIYYRVITAATDVTITLEHYDGNGALITTNVLFLTNKAVGSYQVAPIMINAQGATNAQIIKVKFTAGTANQVFASASIVELPD